MQATDPNYNNKLLAGAFKMSMWMFIMGSYWSQLHQLEWLLTQLTLALAVVHSASSCRRTKVIHRTIESSEVEGTSEAI